MSDDPLRPFDGIVRKLDIAGAPAGPLAERRSSPRISTTSGIPTGAGNPDWERTTKSPPPPRRLSRWFSRRAGSSASRAATSSRSVSMASIPLRHAVNPRFPARLPGVFRGSVSAVRRDLSTALGTDTSGSIRVPRALRECRIPPSHAPSPWEVRSRSLRASTPWVGRPRRTHARALWARAVARGRQGARLRHARHARRRIRSVDERFVGPLREAVSRFRRSSNNARRA